MKKLITAAVLLLILVQGLLAGKNSYQKVIDVYVCHKSLPMAELQARAISSGRALAIVNDCTCHSVHPDFKSEVPKIEKVTIRGFTFDMVTCETPETSVYSCMCTGFESH